MDAEDFDQQLAKELLDQVNGIASQLYFFIKDVAHLHQHHPRHADSLTDVYLMNGPKVPNSDAPGPDPETLWRIKTYYALVKAVLVRRRDAAKSGSRSTALGLLAYASAFRRLFDHENHLVGYPCEPELEKSIKAKHEEELNQLEREEGQFTRDINYALMALGLVTIMVAMSNVIDLGSASGKLKSHDSIWINIFQFFADDWTRIFVLLAGISLAVVSKIRNYILYKIRCGLGFLRALLFFDKTTVSITLLGASYLIEGPIIVLWGLYSGVRDLTYVGCTVFGAGLVCVTVAAIKPVVMGAVKRVRRALSGAA
jgi:hypothetical protein